MNKYLSYIIIIMFRIMKHFKSYMQPDFIIPSKKIKIDHFTFKKVKSMEIPEILSKRYHKKKKPFKERRPFIDRKVKKKKERRLYKQQLYDKQLQYEIDKRRIEMRKRAKIMTKY